MDEANVYPDIPTDADSIITEDKLRRYTQKYNEMNTKLDETRKHEVIEKKKELERLYAKNMNLKKRWANSEIGVMVSSLILTGVITGIVGIFFPMSIAIGIGAGSSLIEIISYGSIHQLIAKKQKHYEDKSIIIKSYLDRLQLLFDEIISDSVITDKEYEIYLKLVKAFESEIDGNNADMSKFIEAYKQSMTAQINREARREVKTEVLKQMKERAVHDILQRTPI
jgi:hypothetical protein